RSHSLTSGAVMAEEQAWSLSAYRRGLAGQTRLNQRIARNSAASDAAANVFREQVGLQVDGIPRPFETQRGIRKGMRNQHDAETIGHGFYNRQANTIHRDGALWDDLRQQRTGALEPDDVPIAVAASLGNAADSIDMALQQVAAGPVAQEQ